MPAVCAASWRRFIVGHAVPTSETMPATGASRSRRPSSASFAAAVTASIFDTLASRNLVSAVTGNPRSVSRSPDEPAPAAVAATDTAAHSLTVVIEDLADVPAVEPVIGPELAAARRRLGLSVDQVAERTRIRPHVIEAIEIDDFSPCGGDFYARGHLRTLARVLGVDITLH